ncbi:MAG: DUF983 domain-containing protein [Rhizobiales bacterium]|nr:DUF983 domain-containing protein [Hyphomicrobiales bacterium]MBN9010753.1 DUF983 domain-containing protein [Hyphomicrobiales bacterium]
MSEDRALYPPLTAAETGLHGRCPRCGQGRLFTGFLTPAERCANCGLDFTTFADAGDGPAVFVIMIVGFIVVGLALFVEFTFAPPYWVHALLWIPLIFILSFALLRPLKGFLLAQTYRTRVAEGRIEG